MDLFIVVLLAFGLSLHLFSVGVKSGVYRCQSTVEWLRTSLSFAFFQTALFVLGWFTAYGLVPMIGSLSVPLGIMLLMVIGLKLIVTSFDPRRDPSVFNVSNIKLLLILSIASTINAFLAGLVVGLLSVELFPLTYIIGGFSLIMAILGILTGKLKGKLKMTTQLDIIGGLILILLGIYALLQYLGYLI